MKALFILASITLLTACNQRSEPSSETVQKPVDSWQIAPALSQLNFVSIKAKDVAELHGFEQLSGSLSADGVFQLSVDLNSVNTGIDIRDERMKTMLFNTEEHPNIVLQSTLNITDIQALSMGDSLDLTVDSELRVLNQSHDLSIDVRIIKGSDQRLWVFSRSPLLLNGASLDLGDGIEALREIAGLPGISLAVPTSFALTLTPEQ